MGQVPLGGTAYQLCRQPAPVDTEEGEPGGLCPSLRISPSSEASSPINKLSYDFTNKTPISLFVLFLQFCYVNVCFIQEFAF